MTTEQRANKLLYVACCVARADYDLANQSNRFDRNTIIANALMLLALAILATVAWSAFFASFLPIFAAVPLGVLIGAFIFIFDQAISASDWGLVGVLDTADGVRDNQYWFKAVFRVVVSVVLSQATATGVLLWLYGHAIDAHLQLDRSNKNAPLEAEYAHRKSEFKSRLIDPLTIEIGARQSERAALQRQVEETLAERSTANRRAAQARVEAGRQSDGGLKGYVRGEGPKYREAHRQEIEAAKAAEIASADVQAWQARMSALEQEIARLTGALDQKQSEFRTFVLETDAQKRLDTRWAPERNDPLMRIMALQDVFNDPTYGKTANQFRWLTVVSLLVLELGFLIIKIAFSPPSVYTVRLIARTKYEAATVQAEYARQLEALYRSQPRGGLRVVGGRQDDGGAK
ncbi:DUF4407 domain-containing protein [Propionivibrio dicarboxylicus]|uniref:DUF4407 domain-containing protein n=1 Tax=Propionivibrio dicarboxylicus TaxID=83767 RepID=A0A1G7Z0M9_9RHOO|nr:DUF4407 domain-containing protein [Propionivibrio dicarboxylicus]SDH02332.1 protein of unknown function [Propionivibrio dicarboxylicus]